MAIENAYNETELIADMKRGDADAFTQIFKRYREQVFRFSFTLTKSRETAEDLVQEVFSKLWERRDQIDTLQSFQGYIKRITYNHVMSFFRKVKLEKELQQELYINTRLLGLEQQHAEAFNTESIRFYNMLVAQLPAQRKKAYLLSRDEGLSYEAIAGAMGISKNTVRNHIAEALQFIRERMAQRLMLICMMGMLIMNWLKK
ncbi:RNA polymerase sigma factor [Niabella sp.]|uniref:RNA polymerase sigma factor n=1 Tax=Niabella sp. TaxID=1962976 RepID=UPI0026087F46|nr:RNA polymerase sigma-70 factor [Niabella sp.]